MVWHLIWEKGAKNWGEFIFSPLPLLRESIRNIVSLPQKPLTVALHVRVHIYSGVLPHRVDPCSRLDRIDDGFAEIRLLHPALGHPAVCH